MEDILDPLLNQHHHWLIHRILSMSLKRQLDLETQICSLTLVTFIIATLPTIFPIVVTSITLHSNLNCQIITSVLISYLHPKSILLKSFRNLHLQVPCKTLKYHLKSLFLSYHIKPLNQTVLVLPLSFRLQNWLTIYNLESLLLLHNNQLSFRKHCQQLAALLIHDKILLQ